MLAYSQRLETGPWFSIGEPLDGPSAHARVRSAGRQAAGECRPYCVYVHVPFCASICSYCALYTRGIAPGSERVLDEYVDVVTASLRSHPWRESGRAPTSVHFGGGTPLVLGIERFSRLVHALREAFGSSPTCEWAVETTTSSLDGTMVEALASLGFQRIHLGIQTLDDATRRRIGRRDTGAKAIERLLTLEEHGFLTSADLIIGFDGVGADIVEGDLRRVYDAGVRMFSICELRQRGAGRLGIRDKPERAKQTYDLWQLIWSFMEAVGLRPLHLGQFGRSQADNLYYTHPARGEDCVAIGPYAHGCAGDVYYGNRLLPEYYHAIREGRTPIEMGVDYRGGGQMIRRLERELLAHDVSWPTLDQVLGEYTRGFAALLQSWIDRRLLLECRDRTAFRLSRDGSWFVGNMIAEARDMAETSPRNRRTEHAWSSARPS